MKIIIEQKDLDSGYYDDELLNEVLDMLDPLEVDVEEEIDSADDIDYDALEQDFDFCEYGTFLAQDM
jgi:hypothetical protein